MDASLFAHAIVGQLILHPREMIGALHGQGSGGVPFPSQRPQPRGHGSIPAGNCYSPFADGVDKNGLPHHPLKPCRITAREAQVGHPLPVPRSGVSARRPHKT